MKKLCQGFTLIEILIAISVMGIILGLSLVQYQRFNRRQIFQQAVEEVKSELRLTQDKALSGERPQSKLGGIAINWCLSPNALKGHRFTLEDSSYTIWAVCDNKGSVTSDPSIIKTGSLPGDGQVKVDSLTSVSVTFNALGLGIGETPPVTFELIGFGSDLYKESITVNAVGGIE